MLSDAIFLWKKQRLAIGSQLAYRGHPDAAALTKASKEGGLDGIAQYLQAPAGTGDRVCDSMRALANRHAAATIKVLEAIDVEVTRIASPPLAGGGGEVEPTNRTEMLERLNKLANELTVLSGDTIVPALEFIESYDVDQKVVTRAYRPDVMEKELKIMALLDRQCGEGALRRCQIE